MLSDTQTQSSLAIIWRNIDILQTRLNYSDSEMSDLFELSKKIYQSKKLKQKDLPIRNLNSFLLRTGTSLDTFRSQHGACAHAVKSFISGEIINVMPLRYKAIKYAHINSFNFAFEVATKYQISQRILRELQLPIDFDDKLQTGISIHLLSDFIRKMHIYGVPLHEIENVGQQILFNWPRASLQNHIGETNSIRKLYSVFFDFMGSIQDGWDYKITYSNEAFTILEVTNTEHIKIENENESYGSIPMDYVKIGFIKSLPLFLSNSTAKVAHYEIPKDMSKSTLILEHSFKRQYH